MKMFSITLGNQAGEVEVIGEADWGTKKAYFTTLANGLAVFESEDYEESREVAMNIFQLNKSNKDGAN